MEFFLFAGLMGANMLFFIYLAVRYTYVQADEDKKVPEEVKPASGHHELQKEGTENKAFTDTPM